MFRKSLFLGLMVLLGAVLVSLVIQGRRQEKKQAAMRVADVIKEYKPTPTRIIAPRDLEIVRLNPGERFAIRNRGDIAYSNPEVAFEFVGKSGRVLGTRNIKVEKVIPPGLEVEVPAPPMPEGTERTRVKVRSAELTASPPASETARK